MKKLFLLFILWGCSSFEGRNPDLYYYASGINQYFLQDLPSWYNLSPQGKCQRSYSNKFFDFQKLSRSWALTKKQLYFLQREFNHRREELVVKTNLQILPVLTEERLFFSSLERVRKNIFTPILPSYNRIHLIWVDPLLDSPHKLKRFFESQEMDQGAPVGLSLCLTTRQLHLLLGKNFTGIGLEILSVEKGKTFELGLDVEALFEKNQRLYFYTPTGKIPSAYRGKFIKKNFSDKNL